MGVVTGRVREGVRGRLCWQSWQDLKLWLRGKWERHKNTQRFWAEEQSKRQCRLPKRQMEGSEKQQLDVGPVKPASVYTKSTSVCTGPFIRMQNILVYLPELSSPAESSLYVSPERHVLECS